MTLEQLKEQAVVLHKKVVLHDPRIGWDILFDVNTLAEKRFSVNRGVVAFIEDDKMYVTRMNNDVRVALEENGFKEAIFFVPFHRYDFKDEAVQKKWESIPR